jgi:hypothetical protein
MRWRSQRLQGGDSSGGGQGGKRSKKDSSDQEGNQSRGHLKQVGGVGMLIHHADDFDLSDDQVQKLTDLQIDFEIEKVDLQATLQKAKIKLRAIMRDIDASEADVMAAIDHVCACEGDVRKMRFKHLKAARAVLSSDQQDSLKTFSIKQARAKVQSRRAS